MKAEVDEPGEDTPTAEPPAEANQPKEAEEILGFSLVQEELPPQLTPLKPDEADAFHIAQERLRARLQQRDFRTAINLIFSPVSAMAGRITGREGPLPTWIAICMVGILAYGLAWATAGALGESWFSTQLKPAMISMLINSTFALICAHTLAEILRERLEDTVIPGVCRLRDLDHIERGMGQIFSPKRHLILSLAFCPFIYYVFAKGVEGGTESGLAGVAATGLAYFVAFEAALCVYFMVPILAFLPTLSRLHFRLFPLNPRDSEVIVVLQDTSHQVLWIFTSLFVPMTFIAQRLNFLHNDAMKLTIILISWIPMLVVYLGSQWTFRGMIVRAKFNYLNHLQDVITQELYRETPPSDERLARIETLKAHHDTVMASPNSAIHFKGILSLANTLLLPVIAALLGNIERLITLFTG